MSDTRRDPLASIADCSDDRDDQTEGRDKLADPLTEPAPSFYGKLKCREIEHKMRCPCTEDAEDKLGDNVKGRVSPAQFAS